MERINRHNYAVFFVDYFDNELNEGETKILFDFLELHPDLKEEFYAFENLSLPSEGEVILDNKFELKKHIDEANVEHYVIADLEGELTEEDQKEFTSFISENALYATTVERYKRTILPKENIVFPHKKELKQKSRVILFLPFLTVIAASIILLITFSFKNKTQEYQFQALQNTARIIDTLENTSVLKSQKTTISEVQTIANNRPVKAIVVNKVKNKNYVQPKKVDSALVILKTRDNKDSKKETPIQKNLVFEHQENNSTLANNEAIVENKIIQTKESISTLKQTIHNRIKSSVFNDESNKNKLINKDYLITTATEKLNDSKNIKFEQEEEKSRKKTRLKLGKFEFYSDKGV